MKDQAKKTSLEQKLLSNSDTPAKFSSPLPVGQLYFPEWHRYETAFRDIFEREYYNNNGPLLTELEKKLSAFLGVKHVICVSNATLGLTIAPGALELTGKVILPAHTFVASAQSLLWAGLEPVFCDVEKDTQHLDIEKLEKLIDDNVSAILGVNLWGDACNVKSLEQIAHKHGITLYFDSAQAFGCKIDGTNIGNFGSLEVFSFHATKILSAGEGGAICTNDDEIAGKLKMIRPSYGETFSVSIDKVANARMSEAQAAVALLSLSDYSKNKANNKALLNIYKERLSDIPGITLKLPVGVSDSNFQSAVCEINETLFLLSRDELIDELIGYNILARRYFYPGAHKAIDFQSIKIDLPITDYLSTIFVQLPLGALVDSKKVNTICDIIQHIRGERVNKGVML